MLVARPWDKDLSLELSSVGLWTISIYIAMVNSSSQWFNIRKRYKVKKNTYQSGDY